MQIPNSGRNLIEARAASSGGLTPRVRDPKKESGKKTDSLNAPIRATAARGTVVSSDGKIVRDLAADHLSSVHRPTPRNPLQGHSLVLDVPLDRVKNFADVDDLNPLADPIMENGVRDHHGLQVVRIAAIMASNVAEDVVRVAFQENKSCCVRSSDSEQWEVAGSGHEENDYEAQIKTEARR